MTWPGDVSLKQCTRGGLSQSLSQRVSTYCDPTIDCICTLPSIESTPSSCPLYIKVSMVRPDSWDRTIWNVIHPSKRILQRTQDKKSCTSEKTVCTSWEKESCRLPYSLPPSPNLFFFSFFFLYTLPQSFRVLRGRLLVQMPDCKTKRELKFLAST